MTKQHCVMCVCERERERDYLCYVSVFEGHFFFHSIFFFFQSLFFFAFHSIFFFSLSFFSLFFIIRPVMIQLLEPLSLLLHYYYHYYYTTGPPTTFCLRSYIQSLICLITHSFVTYFLSYKNMMIIICLFLWFYSC